MRCGLILKKIGMTRFFQDDGISLPVTVLKLVNSQVVNVLRKEEKGYDALQIGFGAIKTKNINKSIRGHYAKSKVEPLRYLKEFRVSQDMFVDVGKKFSINHFTVGQKIDVSGISIGKGFSGGMKRHNFSGLEATHGVSISHRSHGSTGNSQDPGRVWKGKKMAGQYGNVKKTVQNLKIVHIDIEQDIMLVKGSVPGSKNSYIFVKDALKVPLHKDAKIPAGLKDDDLYKDKTSEKNKGSKISTENDNEVKNIDINTKVNENAEELKTSKSDQIVDEKMQQDVSQTDKKESKE